LLGLIAWNLLLYLGFLLVWVAKGRRSHRSRQGFATLISPLLTLGIVRRTRSAVRARMPERAGLVGRALSSFLADWRKVSARLVEARARRLLHGSALALMAGVLGGMYARGLIFEYQATWESTFLSDEGAGRLLGTVLAPALSVTGGQLPVLPPEGGTGDAAAWIHLFAITGGLLVLGPRALLMSVETMRILRLRRHLPLDLGGAYFRRILAAGRGERLRISILPYSLTVPQRQLEKLQTALLDLYGSRASITVAEKVEYGETPAASENGDSAWTVPVVLMSLAQTPEEEVHGELVDALGDGEDLLVILETGAYRSRLGDGPDAEKRTDQRLQAWRRVLGSRRVHLAAVDLAGSSSEEIHRELTRAAEGSKAEEAGG
ncbi:MAG: hypothetical protein KDD47_05940, partial [Acidobacteria bacterium]|nr:hypothetical protein [Acidobacteriota bacterium]